LIDLLIFGVLTPLSTIFQLYHGDQFLVMEEAGVPGENHWNMTVAGIQSCSFFL
jgi:hypothetical protein